MLILLECSMQLCIIMHLNLTKKNMLRWWLQQWGRKNNLDISNQLKRSMRVISDAFFVFFTLLSWYNFKCMIQLRSHLKEFNSTPQKCITPSRLPYVLPIITYMWISCVTLELERPTILFLFAYSWIGLGYK